MHRQWSRKKKKTKLHTRVIRTDFHAVWCVCAAAEGSGDYNSFHVILKVQNQAVFKLHGHNEGSPSHSFEFSAILSQIGSLFSLPTTPCTVWMYDSQGT